LKTGPLKMKRTFESGSQKRRKHQLAEQIKRVPELDSYFTVINEETDLQESETQQPQFPEPTPSSPTTLEISNLSAINITTHKNGTEPDSRVEIAKYIKLNDVGLWDILTKHDISYITERFLRVSIRKRPI
jgi:hypothetical protein